MHLKSELGTRQYFHANASTERIGLFVCNYQQNCLLISPSCNPSTGKGTVVWGYSCAWGNYYCTGGQPCTACRYLFWQSLSLLMR